MSLKSKFTGTFIQYFTNQSIFIHCIHSILFLNISYGSVTFLHQFQKTCTCLRQFVQTRSSLGCIEIKFTYTESTGVISFPSFRTLSISIFIGSSKIGSQSPVTFLINSKKRGRSPCGVIDYWTHNLLQCRYGFNWFKMIRQDKGGFVHINKNRFFC